MKKYDSGVVVDRMTVSIDAVLAEQVRERAQAMGMSVSSWIASAAARQLQLSALDDVVAEYETQHGAFSDDELSDIREWAGW